VRDTSFAIGLGSESSLLVTMQVLTSLAMDREAESFRLSHCLANRLQQGHTSYPARHASVSLRQQDATVRSLILSSVQEGAKVHEHRALLE
jgi:hypothetical protein